MIQDFEEGLADIEGFKDSYVISAGFCNNKRKKVEEKVDNRWSTRR